MKICICTMIKNEHQYLEDWLKYNINLGVDKIFITEDIGSESHKDITDKYSEVEIFKMEKPSEDAQTYRQSVCIKKMFEYVKSLNKYDWVFVIDIDEYITITENISLKDFLNQYSDYSELILYWKNFGANGHIQKPDYTKVNTYREYYTKECKYSDFDAHYSYFMKKAINMNKIDNNYVVQKHLFSTPNYIKTNFQKGIHTPCFDRAYISHYITKSWEEYKWKILDRGMCYKKHRKIDDFFEMNPDMLLLKEKLLNEL